MEVVRQCMELKEAGKPLVLAERPLPPPPPEGFILKTIRAGICHSDVNYWRDEFVLPGGSIGRYRDTPGYPFDGVTLGHEIAGSVYSIGNKVRDLKVGDLVVVCPWVGCRECRGCLAGYNNLCSDNGNGSTEYGQGSDIGCINQGGFSTYVWVVDVKFAVIIPPTVDISTAATLPCAALTVYTALKTVFSNMERAARIYETPWFMIVGCGGLGTWCLELARHVLPPETKIIVVDISESKLSLARDNGADDTLLMSDSDGTFVEQLKLRTGGGPSGVIDFVASTKTTNQAMKSLRKGGQLHCIGHFGGELNLSNIDVTLRSLSITGNRTGRVHDLRELMKLVAEKHVTGPPVEHVTLSEVNRVFQDLLSGGIRGRAVIKFD